MFSETAKLSLEASDVQTDEDCEDLAEDGFNFSADIFEKERTRRKPSSGKPPSSPKSPYLSSLNVNSRRAAVAAWRLPRASLGDTRDLSQTLRSEFDMTPELLTKAFSVRKHKHLNSSSNGFAFSTRDCRDKEDMYDEIIRLKKSLQAQKSDNQKMKAKLRRLEEENAKREKQIEELLDPTKGPEYTRGLVDKKKEGSVVVSGLKQRILKLEQQCREKENALSKLQSDLRTTNLEELKITVEAYFEEIQRLRILLEATEKSSRAESKCSQRQQKALSSTVDRLSENLKQLQKENVVLREELSSESPAGGLKGYRDWSKQRLLRKLLDVEKRLEDSRRHALAAKNSSRLDQEVQSQATPIQVPRLTMATEAVASVGVMTEDREELSDLRACLSQVEKEKVELQETLSRKDDELKQLRSEREELEKATAQWKTKQTKEWNKERQQHKHELEQLWLRIQTVEQDKIKPEHAELSPLCATTADRLKDTQVRSGQKDREEKQSRHRLKEGNRDRYLGRVEEKKRNERIQDDKKKREKAASIIQTKWRAHRNRDIVMLQSAIRAHLLRESQLKDLLKDAHNKAAGETNSCNTSAPAEGEVDVIALTMIQSAFRGHMARCSFAIASPESSVPSPIEAPRSARSKYKPSQTGAALLHNEKGRVMKIHGPSQALMPPG
ncbi:IQ domain-containing protein E isoform X2 [Betta splendens]|uniref:IQ domain-containing protein E isoform X2 n=1 Tax=Betta splendens TaxID=158456 RepID=A0A6P7LNB1_BETSP|nr:IQ domain-containing protein E isoform X2 [Betta splendens]